MDILFLLIGVGIIILLFAMLANSKNSEKVIERDKAAADRRNIIFWDSVFMNKKADISWQRVKTDIGVSYILFTSTLDSRHISSKQKEFFKKVYGRLPCIEAEVDLADTKECIITISNEGDTESEPVKLASATTQEIDRLVTILITAHYTSIYKKWNNK